MCGFGPTVAMLTAARQLGAKIGGVSKVCDVRRYFGRPQYGRRLCGDCGELMASVSPAKRRRLFRSDGDP